MSKINVIKPTVEIVDPGMDPIAKVAKMARICYRSEKNLGHEADVRLVKNCVKSGHTSVTEHSYISVYFDDTRIPVKEMNFPDPDGTMKDNTAVISAKFLWDNFTLPDKSKYIEPFGDDQIYRKIAPGTSPRVYNVAIGNFRAWLNVLDNLISVSIVEGYILGIAFSAKLIDLFHKEFGDVFDNLYTSARDAINELPKDNALVKFFGGQLTFDRLVECVDKLQIVAAPAAPRASLSVVLRTDRAVTHQLVRHRRDVAYSQESQRYCNYENKGYDVVWPQVDPAKYKNCTLTSVQKVGDNDEAKLCELPLDKGGYLPTDSSAFRSWFSAMETAVGHYEDLLHTGFHCIDPETGKVADVSINAEVARAVLPNSFATTIGVTWTTTTFVNLMHWRLDSHAQYPIRYLLGTVVVEALSKQHPFFDNFPPKMVIGWLNQIKNDGFALEDYDVHKIDDLISFQETRQANMMKQLAEIQMQRQAQQEALRKQAEEAAKAKAAAEDKNLAGQEPTPTKPE